MESRRQIFKPEEDFELQHQDLIHQIQGIEIKELPAGFEKHLFAYLLNTRPRKIDTEPFLEFLTSKIKNTTYSAFNNLISFLVNALNLGHSETEADKIAVLPISNCYSSFPFQEKVMELTEESDFIEPKQIFYSELLMKLQSDAAFQKILKEDQILSDKIRIALSELEFSTNQIEQVEPFLFKTK